MAAAQSGVTLSDSAFDKFNSMKMKKQHRYMVMVIEKQSIVEKKIVLKTDDQEKDFEEFLSQLDQHSSCFVILDLTVPSKTGGKGKEQLFYISWCPDTADINNKMVYAATRNAFLNRVKEGTKNVQANDLTDLMYSELLGM